MMQNLQQVRRKRDNMKSKKRVVIIDGNNLAYRAYHSHSKLTHKGESVAVLYGFFNLLAYYIDFLKPDKLFIVWDGGRNKHRLKVLPNYKERDKRKAAKLSFDKEDFFSQMDRVKAMTEMLGLKQVWKKTEEADDYIFMLAKRYRLKKVKCIIVSSDKDFNQLLSPKLSTYNDSIKDFLNPIALKKKFGVEPYQWVDYLTLLGDISDNIPGYPGLGEKKIPEFLKQWGSISNFLEVGTGKIDKVLLAEIYKRNRLLIDLEYFWEQHNKDLKFNYYNDNPKPIAKWKAFKKECKKYRFTQFDTPRFKSLINKVNGKA